MKQKSAVIASMTKDEFDEWLAFAWSQKEPNGPRPFCPFDFGGYCNVAYTEKCWDCSERERKEK